jgi:hypothetical protein
VENCWNDKLSYCYIKFIITLQAVWTNKPAGSCTGRQKKKRMSNPTFLQASTVRFRKNLEWCLSSRHNSSMNLPSVIQWSKRIFDTAASCIVYEEIPVLSRIVFCLHLKGKDKGICMVCLCKWSCRLKLFVPKNTFEACNVFRIQYFLHSLCLYIF